jgi:hypothetical protein
MRTSFAAILRFVKLWTAAGLLFGAADFLFSWNPIAAAPYLAHRSEPVFRAFPLIGFGMIAENINGLISASAFLLIGRLIPGSVARRGILFGLMMWGFWVVSGTMSAFATLNLPASVALANVLFGLPKCLAIGCGIAWTDHKLRPVN